MEALRRRWQDWETRPYPRTQYPPGSDAGEVAGVDLALVDGDAAAVLYDFFTTGDLSHEHWALLRAALAGLDRALPTLTEPGRAYFYEAAELLRAISRANRNV